MRGYLLSGLDGGGGYLLSGLDGGVPTFPGLGGGQGAPTLRSGWGGTYLPGGGYLPW